MNTKDLRWFREVIRTGSISSAAEHLFVSQQGLSKSLKNLENKLGVPLLIRTPNGIEPTPYGKFLYDRSAALLLEWDAITMEIERMSQMERGYLRLCSAYGILRILSLDFILDFQKKYPNINIEYLEFPDLQVDGELEQGNCDVAFHVMGIDEYRAADGAVKGENDNEGFYSFDMFSSGTSLLVYEGHPLAERKRVSFQELREETFIVESRAFQINHLFRRRCNEAGFEPNIIFQTSGFGLCHKLCQQKRGLSIVVDRISQDMTGSGMVKIPLEEEIAWNVQMLCRREFANNDMIRLFENYTKSYITEHGI